VERRAKRRSRGDWSPRYRAVNGKPQQRVAAWSARLDDPRVQFGYIFRLSPNGQRTAFIGLDSTGAAGVLTVMNVDGSRCKQISRRFITSATDR